MKVVFLFISILVFSSLQTRAETVHSYSVSLPSDPDDLWDQEVFRNQRGYPIHVRIQGPNGNSNPWMCQTQSGAKVTPLVRDPVFGELKYSYPKARQSWDLGPVQPEDFVVCRSRGFSDQSVKLTIFISPIPFQSAAQDSLRLERLRPVFQRLKTDVENLSVNDDEIAELQNFVYDSSVESLTRWETIPYASIPTKDQVRYKVNLKRGDHFQIKEVTGDISLKGELWSVGPEGMNPTQPFSPYHFSKLNIAFDGLPEGAIRSKKMGYYERPLQFICAFCSESDLLAEQLDPKKNACKKIVYRYQKNGPSFIAPKTGGELRCGLNNADRFQHSLFEYLQESRQLRIRVTRFSAADALMRLQSRIEGKGEDAQELSALSDAKGNDLKQLVYEMSHPQLTKAWVDAAERLRQQRYREVEKSRQFKLNFEAERKWFDQNAYGVNHGIKNFEFQVRGYRIDFQRQRPAVKSGRLLQAIKIKGVRQVFGEKQGQVSDQDRQSALDPVSVKDSYFTALTKSKVAAKVEKFSRFLCQSDRAFFRGRLQRGEIKSAFSLLKDLKQAKGCELSNKYEDRINRRIYRAERLPYVLCFENAGGKIQLSEAYSTFYRELFPTGRAEMEKEIEGSVFKSHPYFTHVASWSQDLGALLERLLVKESGRLPEGEDRCGYFKTLLPLPHELVQGLRTEKDIEKSSDELELEADLKDLELDENLELMDEK